MIWNKWKVICIVLLDVTSGNLINKNTMNMKYSAFRFTEIYWISQICKIPNGCMCTLGSLLNGRSSELSLSLSTWRHQKKKISKVVYQMIYGIWI